MITMDIDVEGYQELIATLEPARFAAAMERTIQALEADAEKQTAKTVATWNHKPQFEMLENVNFEAGSAEFLYATDDPIYAYVDLGTKPHVIRPKRPGYPLRFASGYKAKTKPGVIGSGAGGPFGKNLYRYEVHHPGTKPRNFSAQIMADLNEKLPKLAWREILREWKKQPNRRNAKGRK